ncbi:MAG: SgcJ/EcaC family oxidoreductase [Planctomycetales bacterium]
MSNSMRITTVLVATAVLSAAWAVLAQVQQKAKENPPASAKKGADAKKGTEGAKAAANPATNLPESAKPAPAAPKGAKKPESTADAADADVESADESAIRKGAEAFVTAYNAHDAKGVAGLFALKAEFTDEDGNLIKGREAIEQDFAEMFTEFPECRIEIEIDTIRVLTPNVAVEEGIVRGQPVPDGVVNVSNYVAVHVKVDGKWLIASVSDFEADPEDLTQSDNLQELSWMVGDWIDESPDSVVKSSCRWDDSGNYLLHEFVLQLAGGILANGSMRIGSDPLTGQIKSWTFNADRGYSEGLWTRNGDEWSMKSQGVNADGQVTSATNVYRIIDNDTITWRSYDRVVGGEPTEDVSEYIVKRQAPVPEQ